MKNLSKLRHLPSLFLGASMLAGGQFTLAQQAPAKPAPAAPAAKPPTAAEKLFKERNKAWGYVIGQRLLLEEVGRQHPELKGSADAAWARVMKGRLRGSIDGVEQAMKNKYGGQFAEIEKQVLAQVRKSLSAQKYEKEQSKAIIELVDGYFNELKLPHKTLRFLTSSDPAFLKNPAQEMKRGVKRPFTTKGNAKAKGVTLQMDFPMSWVILPPTEANGVWLAKNLAGYGRIASTLAVVPLPEGVTMADMKAGLKLPELKNLAPEGSQLLSARQAKIGGRDAGMLIFDMENPTFQGSGVPMRTIQLATFDEKTNNYLQFQFNVVVGPNNKDELGNITKKMMPLFQQMIESVKFAK